MKSRGLMILILALVLTNLVGCGEKDVNGEVTDISFREAISFEEIKKLDGKRVSIVGFMATTSPLDGSYFYLQNMPYQSCPFCVPNTNVLLNTLAVYAPKGQSFKFMDVPVKVTGRIEVGDVTDAMGYSYPYRIVNGKIERAQVTGLEREVRIYTELVDRGFAALFIDAIKDVFIVVNYDFYNITKTDILPIDEALIQEVKETFKGLNPADYEDILETVNRLEALVDEVNILISAEDWENLKSKNKDAQEVYNQFYLWLIKPQL